MSWIWLAVGGQLLNAVVAILDKYIVSNDSAIPRPFVYAFYSCLLAGAWLLAFVVGWVPGIDVIGLPHWENIQLPTLEVFALAVLAAYSFFIALVSMFNALKYDSPSNVMPVIGAVAAIASLGLNYLFLDSQLSDSFLFGIALLAIGTFLVSQANFNRAIVLTTVHSGIFFALHLITMKGLFLVTSFDNGFFWSRMALVIFGLSLLLVPAYIKKIREGTAKTTKQGGALVVGAKILAGVASFMLLKATDWGEVAVVQSLDGLKFVFILFLSYLVTLWLPQVETESGTRPQEVVRKIMYVAIIVLGFTLLFL
jgi:drug/metabolite transporter (DMT)-like permease